MKAFVIFPSICVFTMTLTLLNLDRQIKFWKSLIIAIGFTVFFGGLMIRYSSITFFLFYFLNFIGICALIPCLTYWADRIFPAAKNNEKKWIRILGLALVSTVLSLALCGALTIFAFQNNPNPIDALQNKHKARPVDTPINFDSSTAIERIKTKTL